MVRPCICLAHVASMPSVVKTAAHPYNIWIQLRTVSKFRNEILSKIYFEMLESLTVSTSGPLIQQFTKQKPPFKFFHEICQVCFFLDISDSHSTLPITVICVPSDSAINTVAKMCFQSLAMTCHDDPLVYTFTFCGLAN